MNMFEIGNLQFGVTKDHRLQWQLTDSINFGPADRLRALELAEWIVKTFYPGEAIVLRALKGIEINGVIYEDPHQSPR